MNPAPGDAPRPADPASGAGAAPAAGTDAVTWVNGERQEPGVPSISARDRGFTLADGVFETMRVRRGQVFRLDRHLTRLTGALRRLDIAERITLREEIVGAATLAPDRDASLRLTVSRGVGHGGLAPSDAEPTVVLTLAPMPVVPARVYIEGLSAHVVAGRRNERSMTNGLKTLSYTDAVAALQAALERGANEALFLDTEEHCSEASASNLFILSGTVLVTPPVSCGALPGITRAAVVELATARGLTVREDPFGLDALFRADEAFLTSSLRGIAPLVDVDGAAIGHAVPGDLTQTLAEDYARLVERECVR